MGPALLDHDPLAPAFAEARSDSPVAPAQSFASFSGSTQTASTEALRRQVAERLAEHRGRRNPAQPQSASALAHAAARSAPTRSDRIAAAVAQRYAHSPSYREYLAAEAERATQQARAAAEIATLNAQAVAQAQQQLLDSFNRNAPTQDDTRAQLPVERTLWPEPQPGPTAAPAVSTRSSSPFAHPTHTARRTSHPPHANAQSSAPGLTIRLFEDAASHTEHPALAASSAHLASQQEHNDDEARALDEEIAFRQSPVFEEPVGSSMPLPANLIEFPRQLVAPRKARPRCAEGPLRAADSAPADGQLRIFEVDPALISTTPAPANSTPAPQWTSIWLDAPGPAEAPPDRAGHPASRQPDADTDADTDADPDAGATPLPQIASIARRLLAAAIDASFILAALVASAATFLLAARHAILGQIAASSRLAIVPIAAQLGLHTGQQPGLQPRMAVAVAALALMLLALLYQALFFTFADATPGMRAARIALCTFDDENPTRPALRRRILALLVSACPLGLGLLWATLDEDRLAWHDRITRTYQRSY